jgi:hypothetical protein
MSKNTNTYEARETTGLRKSSFRASMKMKCFYGTCDERKLSLMFEKMVYPNDKNMPSAWFFYHPFSENLTINGEIIPFGRFISLSNLVKMSRKINEPIARFIDNRDCYIYWKAHARKMKYQHLLDSRKAEEEC